MITGIVTIITITAVTALVVSINFLRSLTIVHNCYDHRDKPGFHMIVDDRSRSLESLVNCSVIITIIWKSNFHFASNRQESQRLPMIAMITTAGTESESISVIIAIVNDHQRPQKVNGNHQCSDCGDRNNRNDPSNHMEIIAQQSQRS